MDSEAAPSPASYANYSTSWTPTDGMTPVSTNPSRKRSRDETAFEAAEAENQYIPVNPPEPIPEEPIYGEGMVLLDPQTGRALAAETQTGTWYEDKVEEELVAKQEAAAARPKMPVSRKSARMSQSSIRTFDMPNPSMSAPASPPKSTPTAEVDEATIALGIGWSKMSSEDLDLQAAARGWARYLEVHYSGYIHGAEILLKNRTMDAYLVGCQEGFYLFAEDLLRGQLVGRTWDTTLNNLRAQPIQFEGTEVLQAERTPGPDSDAAAKEVINGWNDWNRINNEAATNGLSSKRQTADSGGMEID
ncbi:hypothetical protein PMZ80_007424 [Knufia obscura]|uniref:Uncharacterized protein n=2 Tax=Knufia TaxID=430999 RepID=A0AAN8ER92_9EURO|nr:hypothetical protein PMZ80_007424 [Knufia obscura]KAK5950488.1 hypothetical protein OHC33_008431 [Knufia fluminis]